MERLSMCRICLAVDLRMEFIVNTPLQDTYERLTSKQLATNDSRPVTACYVCYARLQNCHQLRVASLQSEELFTQMLIGYVDTLNPQYTTTCSMRLVATPVIVESFGYGPVFDSMTEPQAPGEVVNEIVMELNEDFSDHGTHRSNTANITSFVPMIKQENIADYIIKNVKPETEVVDEYEVPVEYNESTFNDGRAENQRIEASTEKGSSKSNKKMKVFPCDICEKIYKTKYGLTQHRMSHTGERPYTCNVCKKGFTKRILLNEHNLIHTGEKPYQCDVCEKRFNRKFYLNIHKRLHTGEKPFQCPLCSESFRRKEYLAAHIRLHSCEKPYQCHVCNESFIADSDLIKHVREHTGETPYQCNVCNKYFNSKSNLQNHTRVHLNENQCNVCKKSFSSNYLLNRHIRIHSDKKTHVCKICKRRFLARDYLHAHFIRVHTVVDKPYQCDICNRCFAHNGELNKHKRIHTNEKSYQCSVCMKGFTQKFYLIGHIRRQTCGKKMKKHH